MEKAGKGGKMVAGEERQEGVERGKRSRAFQEDGERGERRKY